MNPQQQEEIYNNLYQIWRLEVNMDEIMNANEDPNFLHNIHKLKNLVENHISKSKNSIELKTLTKLKNNIDYMLADLINMRAEKLLQFARANIQVEKYKLFPYEVNFFDQILNAYKGLSKSLRLHISASHASHEQEINDSSQNLRAAENKNDISEESTPTTSNTNQSSSPVSQPISDSSHHSQFEEFEVPPDFMDDPEPIDMYPEEFEEDVSIDDILSGKLDDEPVDSILERSSKKPIIPNIETRSAQNETNISINSKNTSTHEKKPTNLDQSHSPSEKRDNPVKRTIIYNLIRIIKDYPALVGEDLKIYGPLKAEDIINLPSKNSEILIEEHVAEKINI